MNNRQSVRQRQAGRALALVALSGLLVAASTRLQAQTGCAPNPTPFTDLGQMPTVFCQAVAEAFFTGITGGTTPTTYEPFLNVNRGQMAAFVTRTLDQSLRRGSQRAALGQFWTTTPRYDLNLGVYNVGQGAKQIRADGDHIWVANPASNDLCGVRAATGQELGVWSGAAGAAMPLVALGRVFACGGTNLYMLDPLQPPGPVTVISNTLGAGAAALAFDGQCLWTANAASVSIITPAAAPPWPTTTISAGLSNPRGILFDGTFIWVTDAGDHTLKRLNPDGTVAQTVNLPANAGPRHPVFDGSNLWVPNHGVNSISVVRAAGGLQGTVLATLTGNGLGGPLTAAFDGERVLVTNNSGNSVSLWKAADLTATGTFSTGAGTNPGGACSDGVQFWITLDATNQLARY